VIAPGRARRPGADRTEREPDVDDEATRCPFCEGREGATPPETFALGPAGRPADAPGWWVRVVPNKFPAFLDAGSPERERGGLFEGRPASGRQEVVIHTPRHRRSLSELSIRELGWIAEAWQARAAAAREQGFHYVQALVNEGRAAGASLAHSHSQLVWLPEDPPLVAQERSAQDGRGVCVLCRLLTEERDQRIRVVDERDGLLLLCPFAGRQPYEMLVAPLECEDDAFTSSYLGAALALVAEGLRRLRVAEGGVAVNAWVHAVGHWHIEVLPRLSTLAGLELGAGYYVNALAPESAAGMLRGA
jgi:UDPglucose--hexose-1-phosphate uridylyltransferase